MTNGRGRLVKSQGTKVEGVINRLFEGHIQKSITCLNVPYKSTKQDAYMDVFLDVRGCKNIYDSFDRLTAKERMDGANQYNAEGYGLQVRHMRLAYGRVKQLSSCVADLRKPV